MARRLEPSELFRRCDPAMFDFETTETLPSMHSIIGQERAMEAVEFGAGIRQEGFNLYAMGPYGSGKHTVIMEYLDSKAETEPAASDWCYVNNFDDPRKPVAIEMATGTAPQFKADVNESVDMLKTILPTVFESDEYRTAKEQVNQKYVDLQAEIFGELQEEASRHGVALNNTSSTRVTFAPVLDGKVLSAEEFKSLDKERREQIERKLNAFEQLVKQKLREVGKLNKAMQAELKELEERVSRQAVETVVEELIERYAGSEKIVGFLTQMQDDIIKNVQDFTAKPEEMGVPPFMNEYYAPSFRRYDVNVFVTRDAEGNAPVLYEDNPTHMNLIGSIEHISQVGTLVTDFLMIKPGAMHRASGGYLLLDARKLLMQPVAYEELKRVLRSHEIRIESVANQYALISTTTLEPEPVPVDVKVVLIGERYLYYLLYEYDPDFKELFKVAADFEEEMPRTDENMQLYARMIGSVARKYDLLPLTRDAVAGTIERSARDAEDAHRLSTHLRSLVDRLKEADYWAQQASRECIGVEDIRKAFDAQRRREDRIRDRLYRVMEEGTLMIDVRGEAVGQINALTYLAMGGSRFGAPVRITARTRMGKGEIVDIQREAELSGPIHAKGVMILSAYLGSKFALTAPLTLSASLVFEQSYSFIEGDSASSTELYALLSSLADAPIRQRFAVTGSVNQFGQVQAIGGVNEKIEGFFDVCMRLDPDHAHGVLIPEANVRHLMLKPEVVRAVEEGRFEIHSVASIDEGIEILTGIPAGEADAEGVYPEGSINARVVAKLKQFTDAARHYRFGAKES